MINELNKLYEIGLLQKQIHPTLPLIVWNYSPKVQYENLWSYNSLLSQCRGLVTDFNGKIIARPLKKFWNLDENKHYPTKNFSIQEKMDGSLILGFFYECDYIICSRGSFTSEQSKWATEMFEEKYRGTLLSDKDIYEITYKFSGYDYTYVFELIKNENRIVCQYDFEDLILLTVIVTTTGEELNYNQVCKIAEILNCPVVKQYDGITDYSDIKKTIKDNNEGFVIKFSNGDMCKIKGEEYCRLHKILTNISNRSIWEYLSENKPLDDIIEKVPDEFYDWVKETVKDFETKFEEILGIVITEYWEIDQILIDEQNKLGDDMTYDEREYGKRFAEEAFKRTYPHLLFSYRKEMLNPVNTHKAIWEKLYPKYQKPFKNENE